MSDPVQLGLLRPKGLPPGYSWLGDLEIRTMLELRVVEEGLPQGKLSHRFARHPDRWVRFTASRLINWLYDAKGNPRRMVLTWHGKEVADALYARALAQQNSPAPFCHTTPDDVDGDTNESVAISGEAEELARIAEPFTQDGPDDAEGED